MAALEEFLATHAADGVIPWAVEHEATLKFGQPLAHIEKTIMDIGMVPSRYQRTMGSISVQEQGILFSSTVAVIGCGGLGGYVIEALARLGIGRLIVADPDVIEEHNTNRQILATVGNVGTPKAICAAERVRMINPAVSVKPYAIAFGSERAREMLAEVSVVIDALDSIPSRLELENACERLAIPLVHAAIAGWHAQIATVLPGDRTLHMLYGSAAGQRGRESVAGIPSFTPLVAAGIQAAEACRLLIGRESALRRKVLYLDLARMTMDLVALEEGNA